MDEFDYDNFISVKPKKKKVKIPDEILKSGLEIKALPTLKSKIKQNKLMKNNVIPKHPARVIFNGRSGSGKSNLLINLMVKPNFYKGYFNETYLISPTANKGDDLPKFLDLPDDRIHNELDPDIIEKIMNNQMDKVQEKGIDKSPRVCVILDDVQSNPAFMRSGPFTALFIQGRHYNISTFICCQQFKRLPKICRLQATNIFFFPSSLGEVETLCDENCPPLLSKKEFKEIIKYATNTAYNFLHINMFVHFKERYRKNLNEILELNM
jgi:hypothetical protein